MGLGVLLGGLSVLLLLGLAGLVVVYTGAYNVAASEGHTALARWAFDTTMRRSVRMRAEDVRMTDAVAPATLAAGARAYKSMCQHCHAGPGVEREKWADGMQPRPPHLVEAAGEWKPSEVYWIVKHGIKMTGMPAFGPSHDEETLRGIAAFVKSLPAMTTEQYATLGGSGPQGHHQGARRDAASNQSGASTASASRDESGPARRQKD